MRCFTTWPMANLAMRIGGWPSAEGAVRLAISMAKVLLRMGLQATQLSGTKWPPYCKYAHQRLTDGSTQDRGQNTSLCHRLTRATGLWTLGTRVLGSPFG